MNVHQGFETCGGTYKKFNVEPDIIVYGKTLANGYALNAVCGRRSVMDAAQKTFISSTFWTERVGPVAALEALSQMEKINSFEIVPKIGEPSSKTGNVFLKIITLKCL